MTTAEKLRQEGLQKGRQEGSYKMMVTMVHNAGITRRKQERSTFLSTLTLDRL